MTQILLYDRPSCQWLHFAHPLHVVATRTVDGVAESLQLIEELVNRERLCAAGFISYEAAPAFDRALTTRPPADFPLLWFGLFREPQIVPQLTAVAEACYRLGEWQPTVSRNKYQENFDAIKRAIARGDTYQVNFTMRLRSSFSGNPHALLVDLLPAQRADYAAYIETNDFAICSVSPELFFRLEGNTITCRPMKGTRPRGRFPEEDRALADELRESEKERAENVMVVDMIRNDLGRIAEFGSVRVPELFTLERYPTVWQLTSTVTAQTSASFTELISALFPCASVTGPPKPSTMRLVADLESTPRRIYTGSIGFLAPDRRACFNVAIRTALIDKQRGSIEYGVGGGIVWDSQPQCEYDECLTKAAVLHRRVPTFDLLETILWTPESGFYLLDRHLQRLAASAEFFDRRLDLESVRRKLDELAANLMSKPQRIRLLLSESGAVTLQAMPLNQSGRVPETTHAKLARRPVDSADIFLFHKTTHRSAYDDALRDAGDCDDVILLNERGEITESTIANVVVFIDGKMFTPPVTSGLLAGTFRAELLAKGEISERVITIAQLLQAESVYLINSVRGWVPALLNSPPVEVSPNQMDFRRG